jgi:hypothetical protein
MEVDEEPDDVLVPSITQQLLDDGTFSDVSFNTQRIEWVDPWPILIMTLTVIFEGRIFACTDWCECNRDDAEQKLFEAVEYEILLQRQRAQWTPDTVDFEEQIGDEIDDQPVNSSAPEADKPEISHKSSPPQKEQSSPLYRDSDTDQVELALPEVEEPVGLNCSRMTRQVMTPSGSVDAIEMSEKTIESPTKDFLLNSSLPGHAYCWQRIAPTINGGGYAFEPVIFD